jgi:hypothetical protein
MEQSGNSSVACFAHMRIRAMFSRRVIFCCLLAIGLPTPVLMQYGGFSRFHFIVAIDNETALVFSWCE